MVKDINKKVVIIPPDGVGSKGDEAMVRGALNLFYGCKITLLTQRDELWTGYLVDRISEFNEINVSLPQMADAITESVLLVIIGADVMDGLYGHEDVINRLKAAERAIELGGKAVVISSSFRANANPIVIEKIKRLGDKLEFYLREKQSVKHFCEQTGLEGKYFTDMAFLCEKRVTKRAEKVAETLLEQKKNGKTIVAVNLSEHACGGFFPELDMNNRRQYVIDVMEAICQTIDNPFFCIIPHDSRFWEGHCSDMEYSVMAEQWLMEKRYVDEHIVIDENLTEPEILSFLSKAEYLISGRMHLAIVAINCDVIPITYVGNAKDGWLLNIEKFYGMFQERLGRKNLVASSKEELKNTILVVQKEKEKILEELKERNAAHSELNERMIFEFRTKEGVSGNGNNADKDMAAALIQSLVPYICDREKKVKHFEMEFHKCQVWGQAEQLRAEEYKDELFRKQVECEAHQAYIDQLLQTEQELKQELNNKEGHIQLLLQSERDLKHEIEKIQSAKLFRIISVIWRIEGKLLPTGSKRRAVLKSSLWLLRHPVRGIRGIVKTGHIRGLEAKPELTVEKPVLRKLEEYETLVFQKAEKPLVSIIVPVYNEFEYTYICLESILKNSGNVSYEIIIADDCSTDITAEIDKVVKNIVVARTQENLRFLRNCNNAAGYARGNYILFLNNDTKVLENWLEPLVTLIESDSAIGMVGSKLIYADGKLQEAGGICWCDGTAWNYGNRQDASAPEYNYVKDVDYISGASLMIRKTLWEEIGGFDENFAPAYCEDSDLAFEVRKHGYRVVYQPKSVVVHFEGVSNGTDVSSGVKQYQVENSRKLQQKWAEEFAGQYPNGKNVFRARERSKDKKIVLFIDHYVPHFDEDAGSKTIYQYLQMFVKKGYLVKFIGDNFYQHEPYTTVLQQMGIEVLYGSYYAQHVFDWIRANKEQIDYAFLNRPHISVKYIDMLRRETNIKTIYYGHDLHFLRNQREYELTGNIEKKKEAEEWRKKELRLMHSADISYYPSYIEKEEIHKIDPSISVKAITAYVYDQFKEDINYDFASKEGVLFVGGFRHNPNADAVLWFVEEIWPLIRKEQEMNFYIVGSYVTEEIQMLDGKNGIVVKGFVSDEELSSLYAQCKMVVVPLRYGAGVKGKVVEAVYNGMPIVTTSVGAEGIENIEKAVVIEDNPEKFAKRVTELYRDNEGLKALAEATQVLVKEQFSTEAVWNIIKDDFC